MDLQEFKVIGPVQESGAIPLFLKKGPGCLDRIRGWISQVIWTLLIGGMGFLAGLIIGSGSG